MEGIHLKNKWIICFIILWTSVLIAYYFFGIKHKIRNYVTDYYDAEQVKKEKEKL